MYAEGGTMTSLVKHASDSQEEMDRVFQAKRHIIFPFFCNV